MHDNTYQMCVVSNRTGMESNFNLMLDANISGITGADQ